MHFSAHNEVYSIHSKKSLPDVACASIISNKLYYSLGLYVVMGLHIRGDTSVGAPVGYYIEDIISVNIAFDKV